MKRLEFTRKTKALAFEKAKGICASCGLKIMHSAEYDHIVAAKNGGDNSLENCQVLHSKCHKIKTRNDVKEIAKTKRIRDKHTGAFGKKKQSFNTGKWKRKLDGTVVLR